MILRNIQLYFVMLYYCWFIVEFTFASGFKTSAILRKLINDEEYNKHIVVKIHGRSELFIKRLEKMETEPLFLVEKINTVNKLTTNLQNLLTTLKSELGSFQFTTTNGKQLKKDDPLLLFKHLNVIYEKLVKSISSILSYNKKYNLEVFYENVNVNEEKVKNLHKELESKATLDSKKKNVILEKLRTFFRDKNGKVKDPYSFKEMSELKNNLKAICESAQEYEKILLDTGDFVVFSEIAKSRLNALNRALDIEDEKLRVPIIEDDLTGKAPTKARNDFSTLEDKWSNLNVKMLHFDTHLNAKTKFTTPSNKIENRKVLTNSRNELVHGIENLKHEFAVAKSSLFDVLETDHEHLSKIDEFEASIKLVVKLKPKEIDYSKLNTLTTQLTHIIPSLKSAKDVLKIGGGESLQTNVDDLIPRLKEHQKAIDDMVKDMYEQWDDIDNMIKALQSKVALEKEVAKRRELWLSHRERIQESMDPNVDQQNSNLATSPLFNSVWPHEVVVARATDPSEIMESESATEQRISD